jgi:hypothetical protein
MYVHVAHERRGSIQCWQMSNLWSSVKDSKKLLISAVIGVAMDCVTVPTERCVSSQHAVMFHNDLASQLMVR